MAETSRKTGFFGQALLILVPVIVLLAVGLNSLRQDKITALRDAMGRAQRLAESLLAESAATLSSSTADEKKTATLAFEVDLAGDLIFPPTPLPMLNPRPLQVSALNAEQARLWPSTQNEERRTQNAERGTGNSLGEEAEKVYQAFLSTQPPEEFKANALYSLGLIMARNGKSRAASEQFSRLIQEAPDAQAESGMPLQPLARLKLLELEPKLAEAHLETSFDSFCSNVVYHPTPLTPALLREAERLIYDSRTRSSYLEWTGSWQEQERLRALYAAARPELNRLATHASPSSSGPGRTGLTGASAMAIPKAFWFATSASTNWLAFRFQESSTGSWFRCRSETQTVAALKPLVSRASDVLEYFGAELRLAGKTIQQGPGPAPVVLGSDNRDSSGPLASAGLPDANGEWLRVNVYLTRPEILYARQRSRQLWFGALIMVSAVAAFMGLWTTWRAFGRQQRLNELKSNFVSSVSHELRTPVAAVGLLIEGLESGKISDPWKQKQYFRLIRQECRRLAALIENILDFSRIEQGRKQFEFEPTDVVSLTERAVRMIEPYAAERHVSVAIRIERPASGDTGARPLLDGQAMEQALLNLVDNAIKHSPEGETVTVGVEFTNGEPGAGASSATSNVNGCVHVQLWVEDKGAGIPAEEHEKIFERFYRLGSELRRETQGIGIGLSIVKHIVESHGGRVLLRSAPGQGSRFTIDLPWNGQASKPGHESE